MPSSAVMLTTKQAKIMMKINGQTVLLSDCPEIPTNSSDAAAKLFCGETQPEPGLKSVLYLSWTSFIFRAWKRRDLGGIWVRALLCCAVCGQRLAEKQPPPLLPTSWHQWGGWWGRGGGGHFTFNKHSDGDAYHPPVTSFAKKTNPLS